jgi:hypothetical protein
MVILCLDNMEELRPLSILEFNFKNIVKLYLQSLLRSQSEYWTKRCTVRWVQLFGENFKFFHAKATERFRHNKISEIINDVGVPLLDHNHKADTFLACFKQKMGICHTPALVSSLSII